MMEAGSAARGSVGGERDGRLTALAGFDILDTPPEAGFDDVVLIASRVCETPVALVSFVSVDRQWFKARIGFDACQTPLDQSGTATPTLECRS